MVSNVSYITGAVYFCTFYVCMYMYVLHTTYYMCLEMAFYKVTSKMPKLFLRRK